MVYRWGQGAFTIGLSNVRQAQDALKRINAGEVRFNGLHMSAELSEQALETPCKLFCTHGSVEG